MFNIFICSFPLYNLIGVTNTSDESDETPNESQDSDNEDGDGNGEEPEDADDVSDGIREDKPDDNKDIRKGGKNANTRIRELVSEVKHYKNELAKRQQQEEIAKLQAEPPWRRRAGYYGWTVGKRCEVLPKR